MHFKIFKYDLMGTHVWRQTQTMAQAYYFHIDPTLPIYNPKVFNIDKAEGIMRMEFPLFQYSIAKIAYFTNLDIVLISRIFSFIISICSALGIFFISKFLFSKQWVPEITTWSFSFSPMIYYYSITPLSDNLALCLAIWSLYFGLIFIKTHQLSSFIYSIIFVIIAALCKLPFIIFGSIMVYPFFILIKQKAWKKISLICFITILCLYPVYAWYSWVIPSWEGNGVSMGILNNTKSYLYLLEIVAHHLFSSLPELYLNYASIIFLLIGLYNIKKIKKHVYTIPLLILSLFIIFYFFYEINLIEKVHDYYMFPFMPILYMIVALGINLSLKTDKTYLKYGIVFLIIIMPILSYFRIQWRWNYDQPNFNADIIRYQKELQAHIPQNKTILAGHDYTGFVYLYYLKRNGLTFKSETNMDTLKKLLSYKPNYLLIDHDNHLPIIKPYIDSLIFKKESLKLYKLKF